MGNKERTAFIGLVVEMPINLTPDCLVSREKHRFVLIVLL